MVESSGAEMAPSRRRYNRIPFFGECRLRVPEQETGSGDGVLCRMIDLGVGGLAIITDKPIATHQMVEVQFGASDQGVEECGRVAYCQVQQTGDYILGIHFDRDEGAA